MNFEKKGKCYFKIINNKTKKCKYVYLSNYEANQNLDILEAGENEEFIIIPCKETERQIIYISGQSGAGKSYNTSKYAEEYHKMYPKRNIYLFSLVQDDPSLNHKFIKRIDLRKILNADLVLEDFKNTLIIMDDIDCVKDKQLKDKIRRIENNILLMGRHHNISLIFCSHVSCRGFDSKNMLNECGIITLFPLHMNARDLKYITAEYIGLNKEQRKDFLDMAKKSRSVSYIKNYPPIVFSSKKAYVLTPKVD
jgi:hypothetical protein